MDSGYSEETLEELSQRRENAVVRLVEIMKDKPIHEQINIIGCMISLKQLEALVEFMEKK